jgi:hypothetical protein
MKKIFTIPTIAAAAVLMGSLSASAALLDFTDDSTPLVTGGYILTGEPVAPAADPTDTAPGVVALTNGDSLLGQNDGLGVKDDEISNPPPQSITITFSSTKRLSAVYFLDLFASSGGGEVEEGRVILGTERAAAGFASVSGTEVVGTGLPGLAELTGLNLVGKSFTFWVARTNDATGTADGALAGIDVAPVPLPASALLLLGAFGGMAAMRRRKKA